MKNASLKPLPVGYSVYHAIAELNRSFEETLRSLEHLTTFNLFRREYLRVFHTMIEEVRAVANEELVDFVHPRELQNSAYYERLRLRLWERRFPDPPPTRRSRRASGNHTRGKASKTRRAAHP